MNNTKTKITNAIYLKAMTLLNFVICTFKFTIFDFSLVNILFIFLSSTKNKSIITPIIIPTTVEYIYLVIDLGKNPKNGLSKPIFLFLIS